MKTYYGDGNVGDTLSKVIVWYLTRHIAERAMTSDHGKLVMVGSFLDIVEDNDILLGVGSNKNPFICEKKNLRILSTRGPLTREQIKGYDVPEIYGDPALLLPFIYYPDIEKKYDVGYIPHYVDWDNPALKDKHIIRVDLPWDKFIEEILACRTIVSSSLHGIVISEAYRIPTTWAVWSDKIAGGEFKFQDYFLGTHRNMQTPGIPLPPIYYLQKIQYTLLDLIQSL